MKNRSYSSAVTPRSEEKITGELPPYRVLAINAEPGHALSRQLQHVGYEAVADTADVEQAITLVDSLLPDAVVIATDGFDIESVLLTIRLIRDRHACAVIVLTCGTSSAALAQYKAARPDGIVSVPVNPTILDASIQIALHSVKESSRTSRRRGGALKHTVRHGHPESRFHERLDLASARAARTGAPFVVGAFEIPPNEGTAEDLGAGNAARRLQSVIRKTDIVVPHTEGKLMFLAEEVSPDGIDSLGNRLVSDLSASTRTKPAAGIALWNSSNDTPGILLEAAEHAASQAKRNGGQGCSVVRIPAQDEECLPEADDEESSGIPSPGRSAGKLLLQRMIGWTSLVTIAWLVLNYAGIDGAWDLTAQAREFTNLLRTPY
jgi:DNA-binding NarL/FixJ family response regulator